MTQYNPLGAVVRGALQNVSERYSNRNYVHDMVFPIIDGVDRETKVLRYNKAPGFRDEAGPRAPGGAAPHGNDSFTSSNIDPINHSFARKIPDEEIEEGKKAGNLPTTARINAINYIANKIDLKKEVLAAALVQETVWSGVAAGGTDAAGGWGHATAASDTFISDITTKSRTILEATGFLPNYLLLDYYAWFALIKAPALLDLINPNANNRADIAAGRSSMLDTSTIAGLIRVPNIIVATAIKNTAAEDVDESSSGAFSAQSIWGNADNPTKGMGFLFYRPTAPARDQISPGYQYRLKQKNGRPRLSTTWKDPQHHSEWFDSQEDTDMFAMSKDAGYLWKDTATT